MLWGLAGLGGGWRAAIGRELGEWGGDTRPWKKHRGWECHNTVDEALTSEGGGGRYAGGVRGGLSWSRNTCVSVILVDSRLQNFMLFLSRIRKVKHLGCRLVSSEASTRITGVGEGAHHRLPQSRAGAHGHLRLPGYHPLLSVRFLKLCPFHWTLWCFSSHVFNWPFFVISPSFLLPMACDSTDPFF